MRILFLFIFATVTFHLAEASQDQLAPFKDKLFAYPNILEKSADNSFRLVEYDRERDLIGRDEIPRRKAHFRYVDRGVRWSRRVRKYQSPSGTKKYFSVGKFGARTKVVVVYVHGQGGNRRQGVNDWTFGGNFNRLQNLMTRNNGLLLTPDFSDFKARGTQDIMALINESRSKNPNAKTIVACGSMGGAICWRIARTPEYAGVINGLFILGSHWNDAFLKSETLKNKSAHIPIYFGHGAADPVFSPKVQMDFFKKIKAKSSTYPARFVMFSNGAHGTPIRMVDWRQELNWMLCTR